MVFPLIAAAVGYFAPGALLSGAGFTAAGIQAGSIAAGIQGEFYEQNIITSIKIQL